ncbi:hypothetical protein Clacol_004360 [Clathrus columnatus]|uniref:Aldehyde dehydrogenase domain-containing protein n=1 Tax=Clathrus columnatus TaxID=1419009 RepID=A0AAV5ABP6_9AGAM|nr:hypothetical protein Clacol_004360 [Clathrus columnatus]
MSSSPQYTSLEEIDEIYATLNNTFRSGKTKSIEFRKDQLLKLSYMFRDNALRFVDTLKEDIGRPNLETLFADAQGPVREALWAYENVDTWIQPEPLEPHPTEGVFNPVVQKVPKGVGLLIGAFNYPLFNFRALPGAIAAGCPVIIKPSEMLPSTSALFAELFQKYLDPSAYRVVLGGIPETTKTCLSPDFVVVLEKDNEAFMTALLKAYKDFYGTGNPRDSVTLLKTGRGFERVNDLLKRTKGKIVAGGDIDAEAKYIAPTIITNVDWDDALMEDEIFGPILPVLTVPDYEFALEKVQRLSEPLCGYSFHKEPTWAAYSMFYISLNDTRPINKSGLVRDSFLTGSWTENDIILPHGSVTTPQVGVGASGMGRGFKGKTSFMEFTHLRPCYVVPDLDVAAGMHVRYPPYTDENYNIIKTAFMPEIDIPRPAGI